MENTPMPLLLLEDDIAVRNDIQNHIDRRNDIKLVGLTSSMEKALELTKTYEPEGIILDIELNDGTGDGFDFLLELSKLNLPFKPLVIVVTKVIDPLIHEALRKNGASLIYTKNKIDFSYETIFNKFLAVRDMIKKTKTSNDSNSMIETELQRKNRVLKKISYEFDLIGIPFNLIGRKYLCDALEYLLLKDETTDIPVLDYVAGKYVKTSSTVSRVMLTAILHAWRCSPIEDLEKYYTAKWNYKTGSPTTIEFIYYYYDKIKNSI